MEAKRGIRNSIILPTLTYVSETWTRNAAQQSRIRAVEVSYVRGVCEASRWDEESNENVSDNFGISATAKRNKLQSG